MNSVVMYSVTTIWMTCSILIVQIYTHPSLSDPVLYVVDLLQTHYSSSFISLLKASRTFRRIRNIVFFVGAICLF